MQPTPKNPKLTRCPFCKHHVEISGNSICCFSCGYATATTHRYDASRSRSLRSSFTKRGKWNGVWRVWIPVRVIVRSNDTMSRLSPVRLGKRLMWRRTVKFGTEQRYVDYKRFSQAIRTGPYGVLADALRRAYRKRRRKLGVILLSTPTVKSKTTKK